MESFGHLRGARLRSRPFANADVKRRDDNKSYSYELDSVPSPPAHEVVGAPELLALQNEFTIQNERLERCLFEWKDANRDIRIDTR